MCDYEINADKKAFDWMVNDKLYNELKNKTSWLNDNRIIKAFFVYRLANDKIISYSSDVYQKHNRLIESKIES